jgi:glucokinase
MESVSIGIDIGGTSIKYGIVNSKGHPIWESKRPTKAKTTKDLVKNNVLDAIHETIAVAKQKGLQPICIGIGTPGLVSNNVILGGADNIEGWSNVHLGAYIQEACDLPTWVANDVDAMAFAEYKNSFNNNESVIFITLGTGIGGAMIINGELFQGHFGCGGELGVFPMIVDGEVQNWEDVGSTSALIRLYEKLSGEKNQDVNGKYLIDQFLKGNTIAKQTIAAWTKYVGLGIAGYINVFNPKSVVIGGGISEAIDLFLGEIVKHVNTYALKECAQNVTIIPAKLGNKAGLTGAALYALSKTN